ncbi:hypothetical protein EMIHUDRAFT_106021 [Emiliania huxleyi CCMP1516]|uniref:Uncharacterized protein n=2 Tax=Emiliania huxleyi TaxID=2903 RepID=A0A0D3IBL6_EMIH1|nr:hypothetical protein EMIHUDRAFT_106021 [Emiliania huxleyi CCMP1516]EOD08651.1 hypothetical protein EMIHUDRAFT_106021 [Emiliania huxleyi CCMP1516]|eukprot:XP_005761080.1 hypothetical protein EMIHUDRAFT_106021 [Emiliania huxleyi CCMP1516]
MSSLLYDLALSPFYDRLVQLWPLWVHPNAITCLGGAGAAASLLAMRRGSWVAACAAFTAYHMLDNMDGKQARRTGKSSRSLGVLASCQICCDHLFGYPAAQRFALCCGMSTLLTCHVAERCSGRPTLGTA